jgi:hypothetical protein
VLLFSADAAFVQRGKVCCFGDNLNNPAPFQSGKDSRENCSSISDTNGSLLFYVSNPYKPAWFAGETRRLFNEN